MLAIDNVTKTFGRIHAVDGISLTVARGEMVALLGPNGAGKTTLTRMIAGITRPDSGTIRFMPTPGAEPVPLLPPPLLGFLPEDRGLYREVPIVRTLTYFGQLRGMAKAAARAAAEEWLARFNLADRANDKFESLSKGNQQKVQFASAVLHRPAFALLDEPFSGLDPVNQDLFLSLMRELHAGGMTILFSAHQMSLVERLAVRVFLMDKGREVLSGNVRELLAAATVTRRLTVRVAGDGDLESLRGKASILGATRADGGELLVDVAADVPLNEPLAAIAAAFTIVGIESAQADLHDLYVSAVTRHHTAPESGDTADSPAPIPVAGARP